MKAATLKPIAIHLPQFHPIPENDAWWGKGFTEWTNVTKAKPLFEGHYQPHLPADMGFYDLRLAEARQAQAELAAKYGIYGFCYYHYWFNGKRLLNSPLDGIISSGEPDFPFMLCWANENWTRRWDGLEREILIKQEYSLEDDREHIRFLIKTFFNDSRYIKVEGKPFFTVYRPEHFPNLKATLKLWRQEAEAAGLKGLYLGYIQSWGYKANPIELGFDCAIEFQPDMGCFPPPLQPGFSGKVLDKLGIYKPVLRQHYIVEYADFVDRVIATQKLPPYTYRGLTPMWDNSARRKKEAFIMKDSSPELYKKWLDHIIQHPAKEGMPEHFIFINAWNEWAEGNHLEPCQKWGLAYLEATKKAIDQANAINKKQAHTVQ